MFAHRAKKSGHSWRNTHINFHKCIYSLWLQKVFLRKSATQNMYANLIQQCTNSPTTYVRRAGWSWTLGCWSWWAGREAPARWVPGLQRGPRSHFKCYPWHNADACSPFCSPRLSHLCYTGSGGVLTAVFGSLWWRSGEKGVCKLDIRCMWISVC